MKSHKIYTIKTVQMTDRIGEYVPVAERSYEYEGPLALADRAAQGAAKSALTTANNTAAGYGGDATSINATLAPKLTQEATNPTGYNPVDLNNMLVASQQGAGGANAGIVGQGNLEAARTRNSGGFGAALDSAARMKQQALSNNALNIQNKNADLKQRQQQAGIEGLQGLYGTDVNSQLKAESLAPEDINAEVNAGKSGWLQNLEGGIDTVTGIGKSLFPKGLQG